jgi:hypothetical protein
MQIPDLSATPRLVIETVRTNLLQNLRPGQIVHASVLTSNQQNGVRLQIGSSEVLARTQLPLTPGQKLVLDVVKAGQFPELRLLQQASTQELQAAALRTVLPRQIPLAKVFEFLQKLHPDLAARLPQQPLPQKPGAPSPQAAADALKNALSAAGGRESPSTGTRPADPFGAEMRQIMKNILAAAGGRERPLTPSAIRQSFLQSGLFLEAALASTGRPPSGDLKASLLLLLQRLQTLLQGGAPQQGAAKGDQAAAAAKAVLSQLVAQTLQQTEGSLARIQLHQLASLPPDEGPRQVWQFELPIQHANGFDSFLVRLEQEDGGERNQQDGQIWRLALNFNLEPIGPITARLTVQDKNVSANFTAEKSQSAKLITERLPLLDDAMTKAGLNVTNLSARQGKEETPDTVRQHPAPLLDEKV